VRAWHGVEKKGTFNGRKVGFMTSGKLGISLIGIKDSLPHPHLDTFIFPLTVKAIHLFPIFG
jgi:hypothetical protein